jgi:hypothetical protein
MMPPTAEDPAVTAPVVGRGPSGLEAVRGEVEVKPALVQGIDRA